VSDLIASEDLTVDDENLGIKRKIFAGDRVPPDLVEAYKKATASRASEGAGTNANDWASKNKTDLETEVERRGLEVEGTGRDGAIVKDDLVAALTADDES
jgi:hypothetical protein